MMSNKSDDFYNEIASENRNTDSFENKSFGDNHASGASLENIIISPYKLNTILSLNIERQPNEHATMKLYGIVKLGDGKKYINDFSTNSEITIKNRDGKIIFMGLVKSIGYKFYEQIEYIAIEGISYSYILDQEPMIRNFQDLEKTYTSIIEDIARAYHYGDVIDCVTNGAKIEEDTFQGLETDWEFIKRLASKFNVPLFPSIYHEGPKFYFGVPIIKTGKINSLNYKLKKDIEKHMKYVGLGIQGLDQNDFIYCEVKDRQIFDYGDLITMNDKDYFIHSISSGLYESEFLNNYILCPKKGLSVPEIDEY